MDKTECSSTAGRLVLWLGIAAVAVALAVPCRVPAEQGVADAGAAGNGTQITAQRMEFQRRDNQVRFFDSVHVKRDSFELWCEKLTLHLAKGGGNATRTAGMQGGQDFEKIVAERNVRVRMNGRTARSDKATYQTDPEVIILQGNATLKEERNVLRGKVVKFYIQEDRGEVIGGEEGRVEAVFYPSTREKRGE